MSATNEQPPKMVAYEELRAVRLECSTLKSELAATKAERDGNWMDKWGACKVCGGEIPHGHSDNCDIHKLEMILHGAKADAQQRLVHIYRLRKDMHNIARRAEQQQNALWFRSTALAALEATVSSVGGESVGEALNATPAPVGSPDNPIVPVEVDEPEP